MKEEAKVLPKVCWGYLSELCASGNTESTFFIYLYTRYCISRGDRVNSGESARDWSPRGDAYGL